MTILAGHSPHEPVSPGWWCRPRGDVGPHAGAGLPASRAFGRYPGRKYEEIGHCPGRAVAEASVTGRSEAASRKGHRGMTSAVSYPRGGRSPDNPSATEEKRAN